MDSIAVSEHDRTVRFFVEYEGRKVQARVAWKALQDHSPFNHGDQVSLLRAFKTLEQPIRKVALVKFQNGQVPLVDTADL